MKDFRSVADAVAEEIAAGRLKAGERLPPQREFARLHAIADSTASRVYQELARRGLTVGQVGRGTFVTEAPGAPAPAPALSEPADSRVDLELNHPVVPEQAGLLAAGLEKLVRSDRLESVLRPVGPAGTPAAREAAADLLARGGWRPGPEGILFAGNGRQAVSAAVAALTRPGARLGVEELTYPVLKAVAARLGVTLVPLAMDGDGLIPEAVEEAHRADPLHAVYVQPVLHNPLSLTMPERRLDQLADVLLTSGIHAIEDAVWGFLRDDVAPLASRAAERTVVVDSLSKRLSPGLSLGFAVAPAATAGRVAGALRSGGWGPMRFPLEAMARWQGDGVVDVLVRAKQREAAVRQEIAQRHLGDFRTRGAPSSYYCWWELPAPWRADTFVAAAARHGIAVTPAAAFSAGRPRGPQAVRLGLASPTREVLSRALATLADLARSAPDDFAGE
ncbi:aminotransferase class I/II-fold pyridoxal phosphate-dependent enzyme [Streptomyces sp. SID4928]|uniref:aminotransferase-like domain-containing protein n=1 Tax=unclassified Streptomyces TaxID=2593676 RepID=UPI0001C1A5A0|nr:PLP-dependent aminotransferase family protein [Streptomyces sp. ACT-1]EGE41209.1 transcriptional regulator, GntR family with aminotransferase domain [Streptomyces sp. ACT-1]MYR49267.1 aminotransferase class I/II-fold pyridoxal phosphate-dependent enzyme [Streptomyces sp. SID4928]